MHKYVTPHEEDKRNFMLKSNSNKIMLFRDGGATIPYSKQGFNIIFCFLYLFTSELNNIFHRKGLKRFTSFLKLIDNRRKT